MSQILDVGPVPDYDLLKSMPPPPPPPLSDGTTLELTLTRIDYFLFVMYLNEIYIA